MTPNQLVNDSIVIDAHLDLLKDVLVKRRAGRKNVIVEDYLESFIQGGMTCVVSSLYVDSVSPEKDLEEAMAQLAAFYAELEEGGGRFFLATCADDIRRAKKEGKVAIMLAFEGAEPMAGNPDMLRVFYNLGVRILGICWSRSNWAADGSKFFDYEYVGYGLTDGGRRLLEIAHGLNMLIDISHINEKGFWEVVEGTNKPLIATHSNTRALCDTPRNLSDAQIEAMGKVGGVICVNGASLIVNIDDPSLASMGQMAAHMKYESDIIGAGHVGIGFDQCDRFTVHSDDERLKKVFDVIPSHAQMPLFVQHLFDKGFPESDVRGILGENVLRVIEKTIG